MTDEPNRSPRGTIALTLFALLGLVLFAGFVALGTWQVYRMGWKRELIERVDSRVHAAATPAPAEKQWPQVTVASDEYRHVQLQGHFLHDRRTLVWASTNLGSGYWVITPLQQDDGSIVLVNRGFVPPDWCGLTGSCEPGSGGESTVTGLLRMSEGPVVFRHNDPAKNSWYTRDVPAMAKARALQRVAPYFVDQDAAPGTLDQGKPVWPQGGLTVIDFPNNHLSYLITWYALALMVLGAGIYVVRDERRLRRKHPTPS
ncbi:MAG TPA: SURF1 family protein [Dyella sp.]|uniref:SURF1 family protein n=1 Tax=Dyella sp. TaxID=1869338 RepID=UPI002D77ABEB|nr:SURF1 family protein [Dyella sp.]HET6552932.1 SURF1 family protein [Dyella sp.]